MRPLRDSPILSLTLPDSVRARTRETTTRGGISRGLTSTVLRRRRKLLKTMLFDINVLQEHAPDVGSCKKIKRIVFIWGAADRSGRGKRCSSCCCYCCCWGKHFSISQVQLFGVGKVKTLSQRGCEKAKTLSQKGWERAKTLSQKGCEKAKKILNLM